MSLQASVKLRFDCVNAKGQVIEIEFIETLAHPTQAQPIPRAVKSNGTAAKENVNTPTMSQRFESKINTSFQSIPRKG